MIVRHYKIYYNVRHQMLQVILNGVQRLMLAQGTLENRRTAIDVCEMVIKWEQWRLKQTEELVLFFVISYYCYEVILPKQFEGNFLFENALKQLMFAILATHISRVSR